MPVASPGRILDPFLIAGEAEKEDQTPIDLIHQLLLRHVTGLLEKPIDLGTDVLERLARHIGGRCGIRERLDPDDVEASLTRRQLGTTPVAEERERFGKSQNVKKSQEVRAGPAPSPFQGEG